MTLRPLSRQQNARTTRAATAITMTVPVRNLLRNGASADTAAERDQDAEFLLVLERIEVAVKRSEHGGLAGGVGHGGLLTWKLHPRPRPEANG